MFPFPHNVDGMTLAKTASYNVRRVLVNRAFMEKKSEPGFSPCVLPVAATVYPRQSSWHDEIIDVTKNEKEKCAAEINTGWGCFTLQKSIPQDRKN